MRLRLVHAYGKQGIKLSVALFGLMLKLPCKESADYHAAADE